MLCVNCTNYLHHPTDCQVRDCQRSLFLGSPSLATITLFWNYSALLLLLLPNQTTPCYISNQTLSHVTFATHYNDYKQIKHTREIILSSPKSTPKAPPHSALLNTWWMSQVCAENPTTICTIECVLKYRVTIQWCRAKKQTQQSTQPEVSKWRSIPWRSH